MPEEKRCPKCGETKLLEGGFAQSKARKDGFSGWCKLCQNVAGREWYYRKSTAKRRQVLTPEQRKERKREYQRRYRAKVGREVANERRRRWKAENPDAYRAQNAAYYQKNRTRLLAINKANREKRIAEDPEGWALTNRRYGHERKARVKKARIERVNLKRVVQTHGMICHICDQPILEPRGTKPGSLTFDHVIPLNRGGAHSEENLRPAHHFCNTGKGDRLTYKSPFKLHDRP